MNAAVWMLHYHINESDRDKYVAWFHDVHIPEKLARSGYTWASHHAGVVDTSTDSREYVAMFGGTQTRVFLDPSPAQLKPRQDALTREMMQLRQRSSGVIFAHEWSDGEGAAVSIDAVHSPTLRVHWLETESADEAIGAYAVQSLAPTLLARGATRRISKLIGVTRGTRHVLLEQQDNDDGDAATVSDLPADVTHRTYRGHRLWPA